jgi:folylpolyglutamate synthase/dihydropteroate synthase
VAHNEQGVAAVLDQLSKITSEVTVICGFSKSKNIDKIFCMLSDPQTKPYIRAVHPVSSNHYRLQNSQELYQKMLSTGSSEKFREPLSIVETLEQVHATTNPGDTVLIFGSFYIMADVRSALGMPQEVDPPMTN